MEQSTEESTEREASVQGLDGGRDIGRWATTDGGGGRGRGRGPRGRGRHLATAPHAIQGNNDGHGRGEDNGQGRVRGQNSRGRSSLGRGRGRGSGAGPSRRSPLTTNTNTDVDDAVTPISPWRNSSAKAKLHSLFLDKTSYVHQVGATAEQVHSSDPLFAKYNVQNFKTNYKNLKQSIETELMAIEFDHLTLQKHNSAFPRMALTNRGYPFWDTHPARRLLEADVKHGRLEGKKPSDVRKSNAVYQEFPLNVFTKHVHQEIRKQREAVAWQDRRNKKGRKQHDEEVQEMQTEIQLQNDS